MNSPPGLKLGVVTPKESGVVIKRWAQCLFFFADFFFAAFFLFLAIDSIPPFQSAFAEVREEVNVLH